MMHILQRLFWGLCRFLLHFRYRVRVTGAEQLDRLRGPTLVMPNHPGYIDPALVLSHLRLAQPLRPLVTSYMYRNPVLYPLMRLSSAFEVPDLEQHSRSSRAETLALIDAVAERLCAGEAFLIYPSGRVQRSDREVIGASRAAADLLRRCPEANVVLVRTRGVWGSMFSAAPTGQAPSLGPTVARAAGWVLASLFFFLPRRDVHIHVEVIERGRLPEPTREALNPYLEQWYNADGPEPPKFVPYHLGLGPRTHEFPPLDAAGAVDLQKIRPATRAAVNELVEEHLRRPLAAEENRAEVTLDQIGLDSLDRMEVALQIEQRFGFRSERIAATLGELWALAEGQLAATGKPATAPEGWQRPSATEEPVAVLAETIAEAFVRRMLAHPNDMAVADPLSGGLTCRRLLVAATLMSRRFAQLQGDAVGVLLPASVGSDLAYYGLHLAGKLPVLLNWTTGPVNLQHAVETLSIRHVVTSRKFIDRFGIELQGAEYLFLEDLRAGIGKAEALGTLAATYLAPGSFLRRLPRQEPDQPAVVLFTSGSESTPKAVPLTHRNMISNVRGGVAAVDLTRRDSLLGFLPPFHSFGLTGCVLMPLLGGMRVVHHPDPTDAAGLVRATAQYRVTMLITTPTFLGYMLALAKPEELRSLRLVITGAEKCPDALFDRFAQMAPQARIVEGYGITECAPIVAANRINRVKRGTIGWPIDGVEIRVVDPDQGTPIDTGETGMLLVRGPNVFPGYLNHAGASPFVEHEGKPWYRTGDLVALDEEGAIHFRGRLKRFLKAGGEMISLPALEEPLARAYPSTEEGPQVAVEGIETPEGRRIVLFTTRDLTLRDANALLTEAGFRGVMRLDEVRRLDAIPMLGTGKTDYKALRAMLA